MNNKRGHNGLEILLRNINNDIEDNKTIIYVLNRTITNMVKQYKEISTCIFIQTFFYIHININERITQKET